MEKAMGFQGWGLKEGFFLTVLLAAGCGTMAPDELRAKAKYTSTYQCSLGYEEAYKRLQETDRSSVYHAIYPESHTATISRRHYEIGNELTDPTTWWVIDIVTRKEGGCQIRVYGVNRSQWETADNIVRTLPNIRQVSR